jgi:hypothetical protein
MDELCNYYNLDECLDLKSVKKILTGLKNEGKINYSIDSDILKIEDLDLDESEITELIQLFDDNDIFEYPDYEDFDDEDDEDFYSDYDDEY